MPAFSPVLSAAVASLTAVATAADASDLSSYSFTSTNLGTSTADRKIVVAVLGYAGSGAVSSVTIDGNTGVLAHPEADTEIAELWYYDLGAGNTSGTIDVVFSAAQSGCAIAVYDVKGAATGGPYATGGSTAADPATGTLNIEAGGVAIGCASHRASAETWTWTNLTEDYDATIDTGLGYYTAASDAFASAQTGLSITADPSTTGTRNPVMAMASWSKA